jgi:hypothetical protein
MKRRCAMPYIPILRLLDGTPTMVLMGVFDKEAGDDWWMAISPLDYIIDSIRATSDWDEFERGVTMTAEIALHPVTEPGKGGPKLLLRRDPEAPYFTLWLEGYVLFGLEGPDLRALTGSDIHTQVLPGEALAVTLSIRLKEPLDHSRAGGDNHA